MWIFLIIIYYVGFKLIKYKLINNKDMSACACKIPSRYNNDVGATSNIINQ